MAAQIPNEALDALLLNPLAVPCPNDPKHGELTRLMSMYKGALGMPARLPGLRFPREKDVYAVGSCFCIALSTLERNGRLVSEIRLMTAP